MRTIRSAAVTIMLVFLAGTAVAGSAPNDAHLPIQSEAALQRYLDTTPIAESPLSRLSPMGRRRFLEDVHFTEKGVGGYGYADLLAELTADEIREVLALFGLHASSSLLNDARDVNRNDVPSRWPVPQQPTAIGRKFDQLRAIGDMREDPPSGLTDAARARAMHDGFERLFGAGSFSLAAVSDTDLDLLFRAANIVIGTTNDPEYFDDVDRLLGELQARNLAQRDHFRVMHEALLLIRDFDRAEALARAHPSLELAPIPAIVDNVPARHAGPTEWAVSPDRYQLLHQAVDLDVPAMVVVVAHPSCGFSRRAMDDIESDPVLGPLFAEHANWLAPQDGRLYVEQLQQWNHEHPAIRMTVAVDRREWPAIDDWATPTFYFFKGGELMAKVSGWPLDGAGHRDEVVAALGDIGLLE